MTQPINTDAVPFQSRCLCEHQSHVAGQGHAALALVALDSIVKPGLCSACRETCSTVTHAPVPDWPDYED